MTISFDINATCERLMTRSFLFFMNPITIKEMYDSLSAEQLAEIASNLEEIAGPIIAEIESMEILCPDDSEEMKEEIKQAHLNRNRILISGLCEYLEATFPDVFATESYENNPSEDLL